MKTYALEEIERAIKICPKFKVELKADLSRDDSFDETIETIETKMFLHRLDKSGEALKSFSKEQLPTEREVLQAIFDNVFIRGVDLVDYERNFSNKESGLYDSIVKLFNK